MLDKSKKPECLSVNFAGIPQSLISRPHWVLWRYTLVGGRWNKVPMHPNGKTASSNKPETWSTFESVKQAYLEGDYSGVGIILTDGLVGLDIDFTQGSPEYDEFRSKYVGMSYGELSPSKRLRFFVFGEFNGQSKKGGKDNKLEMYDSKSARYFTVTGHAINDLEVVPNQEMIDELTSSYFTKQSTVRTSTPAPSQKLAEDVIYERMTKMRSSSSKDAILKLMSNDNSDHGGDPSTGDLVLCNHLAFWLSGDAAAIDSEFRKTLRMRDKWDKVHSSEGLTYGEMTIKKAVESVTSVYSEHSLSDLGNAGRILDQYADTLKWLPELGSWLVWNGESWELDDHGYKITEISHSMHKTISKIADTLTDLEAAERTRKWASKCQAAPTMRNMCSIVKESRRVYLSHEELDKNKDIIGFDEGRKIINLKNGDVRKSAKEDYVTKSLGISNLGQSDKAVRWKQFLDEVFCGNQPLIRWFQKYFGYCMTGRLDDEMLMFCQGIGANGKSVLSNVMRTLFNTYGCDLDVASLIGGNDKKSGSASPDILKLRGVRFTITSEFPANARLNESLIKALTSASDVITARGLYLKNEVSFVSQTHIMMLGNHYPNINSQDNGIWRRLKILPFDAVFNVEDRDHDLPRKLNSELEHIAAWAVEGAILWYKEKLNDVPSTIVSSTKNYRDDQDELKPWIDSCCATGKRESGVPYMEEVADLYRSYRFWNEELNGISKKPLTSTTFYRMLTEKGFKSKEKRFDGVKYTYREGISTNFTAKTPKKWMV